MTQISMPEHTLDDASFSVNFPILSPTIQAAKNYLTECCDSRYGTEPHITVLIVPLPQSSLLMVEKDVREYLEMKACFQIAVDGLQYDSIGRFFFFRVVSPELVQIHQDLLLLTNVYRNGMIRRKDAERISRGVYNHLEVRNVLTYGFPRVNQQFVPHITIGNVREDSNIGQVQRCLSRMLAGISDSRFDISVALAMYHLTQEDGIKPLWTKQYDLLSLTSCHRVRGE